MKKLLSILGVIGVVASSASTVVACGSKPTSPATNWDDEDDVTDVQTKNILNSTGDISKMLLSVKSENLGFNMLDPLSTTSSDSNLASTSFLKRFNGASTNTIYKDYADLRQMETNHTSNWKNGFGEELSNSMLDSNAKANSFISEDKLNDGSLKYLLSDETRNKMYGTEDDYFTPNIDFGSMSVKLKSSINKLGTSLKGADDGTILSNIVKNFTPDQFDGLMNIVDIFLPMANTYRQPSADGAKNKQEPGGMIQLITAHNFGGPNLLAKPTEVNNGQYTGFLPSIFEQIYSQYKKMDVRNDNNADLYDELMGSSTTTNSNGDYILINNVFHGDESDLTNSDGSMKEYNDWDENDYENCPGYLTDKTWFDAQSDTGLFGQVISDMGKLKFHLKDHQSEENTKNSLAGADEPYETYHGKNFILIDKDIQQLMKDTIKLFTVSESVFTDSQLNDALNIATKSIPTDLTDLVKQYLGVDIGQDSSMATTFFKLIIKIAEDFFDMNTNVKYGDSKTTVEAQISDEKFNSKFFDDMRSISNLVKSETWFDSANDEYVKAVHKAMGITDDGTNFVKDSFLWNFKNTVSNLGGALDGKIDASVSENWLMEYVDAAAISPDYWHTTDIDIDKNDLGDISKISYTLEYKGYGNDDVAQNKANMKTSGMTLEDVYANLSAEDNGDFKDKYLGDGMLASLNKVDRKYTVTWVNKKSATDTNNGFYLDDVQNTEAYINGQWMSIIE